MKTKTPSVALAILSQQQPAQAALSFSLGEIDLAKRRVQILPDGFFRSSDGRTIDTPNGQWLMDDLAWQSIAEHAKARKNDFHFDYEHQTLNSDNNGQPAPAAGWFKELEYIAGEGLFAVNVDWTPKAKAFLENKEYRYTSAVFTYDKTTGRPIALLHVALTNHPALDGMKAVEALTHSNHQANGAPRMNEALKLLLGLLHIDIADADLSDQAVLTQFTDKAKTAIAALNTKAEQADNQASEIATLKAKAEQTTVDLSQFVPKATYDATVEQLAALTAQGNQQSIKQLLDDNKAKVLASERDYLTQFAEQQGVAALKTLLDARPAIAALTTEQSQQAQPASNNTAVLTAEDKYTADQLGLSHSDYLKYKQGAN